MAKKKRATGDERIDGPHFHVASDHRADPPTHSFILTVRASLPDVIAANALGDPLRRRDHKRCMEIIGSGKTLAETKFSNMLKAALTIVAAGTGGIPNDRVIADYAEGQVEYSFELHTQVFLHKRGGEAAAATLRAQLRRPRLDQIMKTLTKKGTVVDSTHLRMMLRAALG